VSVKRGAEKRMSYYLVIDNNPKNKLKVVDDVKIILIDYFSKEEVK